MNAPASAVSVAIVPSPLGPVRVLAQAGRLTGLYFVGQRDDPQAPEAPAQPDDQAVLERARAQLAAYFSGSLKCFDLPLALQGTPFQQQVWQALLTIPYGATASYAGIALHCGRPKAVRAAGGAIGRNPVSIIVPCHRVIGRDGSLTGFGGGLERKQALLRLEGVLPATLAGFEAP